MKRLHYLFLFLCIMLSCSDEANIQGYYVDNLKGIDLNRITVHQLINHKGMFEDSTLLFGFRNQKIWIGLFNEHTKKQLHEWESIEVYKEKEYKIDYGRTITWNIESIDYILKTDLGYACCSRGIAYGEEWYGEGGLCITGPDLFFFKNDDNVVHIHQPEKFGSAGLMLAWYNESVIQSSSFSNGTTEIAVFSMEGKILANLKSCPDKKDIPISYTEGIRINRGFKIIDRFDYQTGESIWEVPIEKVQVDALMTVDTIKRTEEIWEFICDITNKDGSKEQIKFTLNIKNGILTYI